MAEEVEFELQRTSSPAKVAERLRRLAGQLENGPVILDEDEIAIPEKVAFKIEFEEQYHDDDDRPITFEIEAELKWPIRMGQQESDEAAGQKELILFQENHITTRMAAAKRLRKLADKIEGMNFTLGDHRLSLPEQIWLKLEYEAEAEAAGGELEIEIQWTPWEKMGPSGMAD